MAETILITGANRGIGLALTKLSLIKNLNIEACFRDKKKSEELKELSSEHPNLNIHEMDVYPNSDAIVVNGIVFFFDIYNYYNYIIMMNLLLLAYDDYFL